MLDPTWEAPDGSIVPLDGFLEPYFQEVYLEADSIPLFSRLVKELSAEGCPTPQESAEPGTYQVIARNLEVLSELLYALGRQGTPLTWPAIAECTEEELHDLADSAVAVLGGAYGQVYRRAHL